ISYNKRSDSIVLLLPIIINSGTRRFENSIYNPLVEISVRKLFFEFIYFIPFNFEQ
ncbi:hypothetical protein NEUTE1DRAFT_45944, partial [Neurospora tetrasperma FGSC 2508]